MKKDGEITCYICKKPKASRKNVIESDADFKRHLVCDECISEIDINVSIWD